MDNLPSFWTVIEPELLSILWLIDLKEAARVQAAKCPHCGAVLHRAVYPRKPRGVEDLPPVWGWRLSFCCAVCRRRTTPKSVRFLGRKVYLGIVVLVACVLRSGYGEKLGRVADKLDIKMSTLRRWVAWWQCAVMKSKWWAIARVHVIPPLGKGSFIGLLYERFWQRAKKASDAVVKLLQFISPLTVPVAYPA